jgi:AAA15 family ATPase/GTPase
MIKAIQIQNFKSIKNAYIDLDAFNVLIGKNGSGKSTLITAINLTVQLTKEVPLSTALRSIAPVSSELFNDGSEEKICKIELFIDISKTRRYKFDYVIGLNKSYNEKIARFVIVSETLSKIIKNEKHIIYNRKKDKLFKGDDDIFVPTKLSSDKLVLGNYFEDEVTEVAHHISEYTTIDSIHTGKGEERTIIDGQRPDMKTVDGIATALFIKSPELLKQASDEIKEIIPDFMEPVVINLNEVNHEKEEAKKDADIAQFYVFWSYFHSTMVHSRFALSGGDLRTILLIYTLFLLPENSSLAIEEIENGIHVGRIKKLIDLIKTVAKNKNIQLLITTHSLEVLGEMVLTTEVVYSIKDKKKGTYYRHLTNTDEYKAMKEELHDKEPDVKDFFDSGFLIR